MVFFWDSNKSKIITVAVLSVAVVVFVVLVLVFRPRSNIPLFASNWELDDHTKQIKTNFHYNDDKITKQKACFEKLLNDWREAHEEVATLNNRLLSTDPSVVRKARSMLPKKTQRMQALRALYTNSVNEMEHLLSDLTC